MPASVSFAALGSIAVVCTVDPAALPQAREVVECELEAIDLALSRFRDDSELSRLNRSAGEPFAASELLLTAVRTALSSAQATVGAVDPTIGRALRLAGYDRDFTLIGGRSRGCHQIAVVPGWQSVELDEETRTITVPPGVELDLGATGKALAADRSASAAAAATGTGVLVSLGGDVSTAGEPPAGGWAIRIADNHRAALDSEGPAVSIGSGGLATSGTAVRRWRQGEVEMHHIVDPLTARPVETPWRTATVAAASCVDANTASTAAIVLGRRAPAWLAERGLPARLVGNDGEVVRVGDWPEDAA